MRGPVEYGKLSSSQAARNHRERMIGMMEMLKWKVIELLVRMNVLAVAPVKANSGRGMRR